MPKIGEDQLKENGRIRNLTVLQEEDNCTLQRGMTSGRKAIFPFPIPKISHVDIQVLTYRNASH